MPMSMAYPPDVPFCLTPVSADGHSPVLSPLPLWKRTPVRLESCLPAIAAVVQAIVAHRVSQGDALAAEAALARRNGAYDLASAALASPTPHASISGFERAFFDAQFHAALSPADDPSRPFARHPLPDISVPAYVSRLLSMSPTVSNASYLLTLLLLARARLLHPGLFLRSSNAHRLLLAAFAVAAKAHEDDYIPNAEFARVGGVPLQELNRLEAAFLALIGWRTHFSKEEFAAFEQSVVVEALDAPHGLTVFQSLRARNVAGLDEAVRSTSTWALPPPEALSPVAEADAWSPAGRPSAKAARLRQLRGPSAASAAVGGIASAIARFNFPEVPVRAAGALLQLQQRVRAAAYAHKHCEHARLQALFAIVNGTSASTDVPSMVPVFVGGLPPVHLTANARAFAGVEFAGGEHCAAKASVNFLLNDTDPFEGLPRAPPGFGGRCEAMADEAAVGLAASRLPVGGAGAAMLAMERECGLEGLLQ